MTITEHQKNVKTFLSYDFVKGPSLGRLLFVGRNAKGYPVLREVNVNTLNTASKIEFFFSDGKNLKTVVNYIETFLLDEALQAQATNPEKWKMQFARLKQKVDRYNENHWLSVIDFENPLIDEMRVSVTIPNIPDSLDEEKTFRRFSLKVSYSPFTTFAEVESVIRRVIGPEGFLVDGEDSDRLTIADLAKRKITISSWLANNEGRQLKITYRDFNLRRYLSYSEEKGYAKGYYRGYANAVFYSAPRTSRRMMMGMPELESDKAKTDEELIDKYNRK